MRKAGIYLIIVFHVGLMVSLIKGLQLSIQSRSRASDLALARDALLAEKQELDKRLEYVQSPEYLEKVARDELHLTKPGETVVILPDQLRLVAETKVDEGVDRASQPNYLKWWGVLVGE